MDFCPSAERWTNRDVAFSGALIGGGRHSRSLARSFHTGFCSICSCSRCPVPGDGVRVRTRTSRCLGRVSGGVPRSCGFEAGGDYHCQAGWHHQIVSHCGHAAPRTRLDDFVDPTERIVPPRIRDVAKDLMSLLVHADAVAEDVELAVVDFVDAGIR